MRYRSRVYEISKTNLPEPRYFHKTYVHTKSLSGRLCLNNPNRHARKLLQPSKFEILNL